MAKLASGSIPFRFCCPVTLVGIRFYARPSIVMFRYVRLHLNSLKPLKNSFPIKRERMRESRLFPRVTRKGVLGERLRGGVAFYFLPDSLAYGLAGWLIACRTKSLLLLWILSVYSLVVCSSACKLWTYSLLEMIH